ncbi:kinase-associated lipoprotein B [Anaerobacillus sp. MEB173]|uniref:kinase-associated lipoprotein B n=1 Tax=Anaerobacillus sp. MEB173 TaxID=3383345 RepID=UPI003F8FD388
MNQELEIGQVVTGVYKTGKYIGEITLIRPAHYVIRVMAVLKHPQQGDLHNPKQADVPFFHERRALAYREQVNIPKTHIRVFNDPVPDYKESLKIALKNEYTLLEKDESSWAQKSLEMLKALEADYFKK